MKTLNKIIAVCVFSLSISFFGCNEDEGILIETITDESVHSYKEKFPNQQKSGIGDTLIYFEVANFDTEFTEFLEFYVETYPEGGIVGILDDINEVYIVTTQNPAPDSTLDNGNLRKQLCWLSDYDAMIACQNRYRNFAIGYSDCAFGHVSTTCCGGNTFYQGFADC